LQQLKDNIINEIKNISKTDLLPVFSNLKK
jgi:hypothetical protein